LIVETSSTDVPNTVTINPLKSMFRQILLFGQFTSQREIIVSELTFNHLWLFKENHA
jgi:hypothetical protein